MAAISTIPSRIHPTAIVSRLAELADDVSVGPHAVIENQVRVGPGCVLHSRVHLCGPLTMGRKNIVYSGAVLGDKPQHMNYNGEPTFLEIGDENSFREHVTVHRGTRAAYTTRIGSRNTFMPHSHVAHDCQVGSDCTLETGALVAGHCVLQDHVHLSGNAGVHQFIQMGRFSLLSDVSITTKDVPPFVMQHGINVVSGLNLIGMRQAGIAPEKIEALRHAFRIIYREGNLLSVGLLEIERELPAIDVITELVSFIRDSKKGINLGHEHPRFAA